MNETFDYIGLAGVSLSIAERTAVKCSLTLLEQSKGRRFELWGKVLGYGGDYLIAQGLGESLLDPCDSYYSTDGGTGWTALAPPTADQTEFCDQLRGPFMGNPAYEYKLQKDVPAVEVAAVDEKAAAAAAAALADTEEPEEKMEGDDEAAEGEGEEGKEAAGGEEDAGDEEKKPVGKKRPKFQIIVMSEAVRLSYFIAAHDSACKIVPRGAFIRNDQGVVKNKTFRGLSVEHVVQLRNYFKLQLQADAAVNAGLFGANYTATSDFLTSIVDDVPQGTWSAKFDATLGVAVLQNLCFLGSIWWHKPDTASFGRFYVGNGERNLDLCFMLP